MTTRAILSNIRFTPYGIRIGLISMILMGFTLAAIVLAPRVEDVTVIGQTPERSQVPRDSLISVTFSRAVDQNSAERAIVLYPLVKGRFSWRDERTIVFTPAELLRPQTVYHITIPPGLRDVRGHINRAETVLSFRTQ
ncbi:MAG: Ig-like domain-containing protein [Roseiflexaceae bacterium]